jgi:hypothetical protein
MILFKSFQADDRGLKKPICLLMISFKSFQTYDQVRNKLRPVRRPEVGSTVEGADEITGLGKSHFSK